MSKIVISKNDYYIIVDNKFFGPYHSLADAETSKFKVPAATIPQNFRVIKPIQD